MSGEELRVWREGHGWNQKQAARYLGSTQVNVSRWERGTHKVPESIRLLAHLLHDKKNIRFVEKFFQIALDT